MLTKKKMGKKIPTQTLCLPLCYQLYGNIQQLYQKKKMEISFANFFFFFIRAGLDSIDLNGLEFLLVFVGRENSKNFLTVF